MSGESAKQRVAFNVYWYLGPARSLEAVAETIAAKPRDFGFKRGPHPRTLSRWSARFGWQERLAEMESEARRVQAEEQVDELRRMNERHIKEALALQQKGIARLQTLDDQELKADDARRAIIDGIKLERLVRGEPTERSELKGEMRVDQFIAGLSERELRRIAGLSPEGSPSTDP